jgi:hypothetical protein
MGNEQLNVLHNCNQVILNLYPPPSTPARSFQAEPGSLSKGTFHKMLADLDVSFCRSALCLGT